MRFRTGLGAAALAVSLATGAFAASTSPTETPSPEKVALARQLVDASGGADQMKTLLQTVFSGMSAGMDANMPADQKRLVAVVMQKMQDRFIAATPQLIDGTVQIYAGTLTEKELRDYIAWLQSDTGQSLKRKLPLITAQSIKAMAPVLVQVTQGIKQDVIDEACKQAGCSDKDRTVLTEAMNKVMPRQPGSALK